jgi:hypothetical protein
MLTLPVNRPRVSPCSFFAVHGDTTHFRRPMTFFTELATNASSQGVRIIMYVGNDDGISPHFGTEGRYTNFSFRATVS